MDLLGAVAAVERGSEHPLAHAIVEGARLRGAPPRDFSDLGSTTGEGVEATVDGRRIAIGNEKMMRRPGPETRPGLPRPRRVGTRGGP